MYENILYDINIQKVRYRGGKMSKNENRHTIKDEIKGYITFSGWQMGEVANMLSDRKSKVALQNLSNKLTKETIKYSEVKKIADILGYEIKWEKK